MDIYCIYSTYMVYSPLCPLAIYSYAIMDEDVNPLAPPPQNTQL